MTPFTHLHLHTEFSLLDGCNPIEKLAVHCAETGVKAAAITDHGNLYGFLPFYKAMKKVGVKPIIGCEIYMNPISGMERSSYQDPDSASDVGRPSLTHLTLLARNDVGFRNLSRMISRAHGPDFHYKPVVTDQNLIDHSEGIICLSGCMTGRISRAILSGNSGAALRQAQEFQNIFGKENFFIEVHNHGMPEQIPLGNELRAIARHLDTRLVAANDVHYLRQQDAAFQDAMVALNMGKAIRDTNRLSFMDYQQYWFKTRDEMAVHFTGMEEALDGPDHVASLCDVTLDFSSTHYPSMPGESSAHSHETLQEVALASLGKRISDTPANRERLNLELAVIKKSGFSDYFLLVSELRNWALEKRIPVGPARGSAAGSLLAYGINITDIEPMRHGLLFERFLNPERISPPDIDMDFCSDRRGEIIEHIRDFHGRDRVCQVVTIGTYKAKSAIKDAFRGYEIPLNDAERVSKMVEDFEGDSAAYFAANADIQKEKAKGGDIALAIDLAEKLVRLPRQLGVHAAAVVITPGPTPEFIPVGRAKDGNPVTMADMDGVTSLGLLKLDILGLKTCSLVDDAVRMVEANGGILDINDIDPNDEKTGNIYASGNALHVFQIEDPSIQQFCASLPVRTLDQFALATSLCRPGPMQFLGELLDRAHGKSPIEPIHPKAPDLGADTYGILLYQEQVMEAARRLGGFSLGEADLLRRAIGKKDDDKMEEVRVKFLAGCTNNGITDADASKIFDILQKFAGYGFNKSHAIAYATLSWQTAYLKAHHPSEFFAASLGSEERTEKIGAILRDAERNGVICRPPDVNASREGFYGKENTVFFGLSGISGIRSASVTKLLEKRPFTSFYDLCLKTLDEGVTVKDLTVLAGAGALDSFGDRGNILNILANSTKATLLSKAKHQTDASSYGGGDLFAAQDPAPSAQLPDVPEHRLSNTEKYLLEKKLMGFCFTQNPLTDFLGERPHYKATPICHAKPDTKVTFVALADHKEIKVAKKNGSKRGVGSFSDETGTIPFVAWWARKDTDEISPAFSTIEPGYVYLVDGKVDHAGQFTLQNATLLKPEANPERLSILVNDAITDSTFAEIEKISSPDGIPTNFLKRGTTRFESLDRKPVSLPVSCDVFREVLLLPGISDIARRARSASV